ncbi:MAG: hypothetical protein CMJ83_01665 [Planctomycetes bacterium]|nr:hypothetical protein [Planctomycetota bacterium]
MRCVLCLAASAWIALAPAQSGLAAHWRLDETTGTVASDSSANANDGTLVGFPIGVSPWTAGAIGGALTFSGAQHVNCTLNGGLPAYDASGSPFTITAWVNGPPQDDDRFYAEGSSTNNMPLYTLGSGRNSNATPDRLQLFVRNDTGATIKNAQSTLPVFDSTWHHVAIVDVGGSVVVYIDGVPDATNFSYVITGTHNGVDRVALGAVLRAGTCCLYNGLLDDVRVYSTALTANDVVNVINNLPLVPGFQTNQAGASLVVDGTIGSTFGAAPVSLSLGQAFDLTLSTSQAGLPWEMAIDVVPAIPNAQVFTVNIVNVSFTSPTLSLLNNSFSSSFGIAPGLPGLGGSGGTTSATLSLTAPLSAIMITTQFAMFDPSSPDGFSASGPADITVQ